jgi:secreted trypsin-like serine protease
LHDENPVRRLLTLVLGSFALLASPAHAIMYGEDAGSGEYPWTVALVFAGSGEPVADQFCGGTLIDAGHVLTAAHCAQALRPSQVQVVAGETDLTNALAPRHDVASIALHPYADVDEDTGAPPRRDLAVLTLAEPVAGGAGMTIPIGQAGDVTPSLLATGWGIEETGAPASTLQVADLDHVTDASCIGAWGSAFHAQDAMCAIGSDGTHVVDTCNGDSGGPLVRPGTDPTQPLDWRLVGATSFGSPGCDLATRPGVYARVVAPGMREFAQFPITSTTDDDAAPQPYRTNTARPTLAGTPAVGQTVACGSTSGPTWSVAPVALLPVVRALTAVGSVETLAIGGSYTVRSEDVASRLFCELRARAAGAGGYGVATSNPFATEPVPMPVAPATSPTVTPAAPEPAPQPTVELPVTPSSPAAPAAPADVLAPGVTSIRRSCRKRTRTCSFVVVTGDATPSAGVKALGVTLTSAVKRKCRRKRRKCTRSSTRGVRAKASTGGRFTFKLKKLKKGVHTLLVTAVDGAGNVQRVPKRLRFRIR